MNFLVTPNDQGFKIELQSAKYNKGVMLQLTSDDGFFEDNFFNLEPNTPLSILYEPAKDITKEEVEKHLQITTLADLMS